MGSGGCVEKKSLRPDDIPPVPEIRGFQGRVESGRVVLSWVATLKGEPIGADFPYEFSLQRHRLGREDGSCRDRALHSYVEIKAIDSRGLRRLDRADGWIRWTDESVELHSSYCYRIEAVDGAGRVGAQSRPLTIRVLPTPPVPSGLSALPEPRGLFLTWEMPDLSKGQGRQKADLRFVVERRSERGEWKRVSKGPLDGTSYLDPQVAPEEFYSYRVRTVLRAGDGKIWSEPSKPLEVRAPETPTPPPPETVLAIPAEGALEVHWTESSVKAVGYHVYRRCNGEIMRLTSEPVADTVYVDDEVEPGELYSYAVSTVTAVHAMREGLLSPWVEIRSPSLE
jgi:hypothetical protein